MGYNPPQNYGTNPSMIGYTYLNQTNYKQPMMTVPQYQPYMGISPNKPVGPQFFPQTMGPQPMYPMPSNYQPQMGYGTNVPMTTGVKAPLTTSSTTLGDAKKPFNKDAPAYFPKTYKKPETKEPTEEIKPVTKPEEPEKIPEPVKEIQAEPTITQPTQPTPTSEPQSQNDSRNPTPGKTNIEKGTSKLKDLFDSKADKVDPKKPIPTVKKPVASVTTPTPGIPVKGKKDDMKKVFEEKQKQLLSIKKEEKQKVAYTKPIKKEEQPEPEEYDEESDQEPEQPEPEKETIKEEPAKKYRIERHYFLINEGEEQKKCDNKYSIDYILSFRNWAICSQNLLLGEVFKKHIDSMQNLEDAPLFQKGKGGKNEDRRNVRYDDRSQRQQPMAQVQQPREDKAASFSRGAAAQKINLKPPEMTATVDTGADIMRWGRKDVSEAEREAAEFKTKFDEHKKKDPIKSELTELLNILTVDNYEDIKAGIFEKIEKNVDDQGKFLDVLFKKAVNEKSYVTLYAKLCKELDLSLPQKSEKAKPGTKQASVFRSKLLDKCKEIFKTDNNIKIDQYIKVTDPEERESKLKKFLLGNVNFIGELINAKILSRKIVFQCLKDLFARVEKVTEDPASILIKNINIEAIVILIDKFGTLINKPENKIKEDELHEFNNLLDMDINKLDLIQEKDKIPGHLKYKIINLIEKRRLGWEEGKIDKTIQAKSLKEVRADIENEQRGLLQGPKGMNKLDQETVKYY